MEIKEILKTAVNALDSKKAIDISAVRVGDITVIADYFVMATATSSTHVRALSEAVEDKLSSLGVEPNHIEGNNTGWTLLDYGAVVVHVFGRESREFYNLDHVWSDGEQIDINELLTKLPEESK